MNRERTSLMVMTFISSAFKPHIEKWLAGIQDITDPMKGLETVRADSNLVGDQLQEAKMRDYTHARARRD